MATNFLDILSKKMENFFGSLPRQNERETNTGAGNNTNTESPIRTKKTKQIKKAKKTKGSYILYWKEQRKTLKGKFSGMKGAELDKLIQKNWSAMSLDQRQKYSKAGHYTKSEKNKIKEKTKQPVVAVPTGRKRTSKDDPPTKPSKSS